ncbi:hypothetical protein BD413DRAFT_495519 [Trametes elegans]|nr:hypothetical protein BD413DRAFT_495519 [Trametes elegans]
MALGSAMAGASTASTSHDVLKPPHPFGRTSPFQRPWRVRILGSGRTLAQASISHLAAFVAHHPPRGVWAERGEALGTREKISRAARARTYSGPRKVRPLGASGTGREREKWDLRVGEGGVRERGTRPGKAASRAAIDRGLGVRAGREGGLRANRARSCTRRPVHLPSAARGHWGVKPTDPVAARSPTVDRNGRRRQRVRGVAQAALIGQAERLNADAYRPRDFQRPWDGRDNLAIAQEPLACPAFAVPPDRGFHDGDTAAAHAGPVAPDPSAKKSCAQVGLVPRRNRSLLDRGWERRLRPLDANERWVRTERWASVFSTADEPLGGRDEQQDTAEEGRVKGPRGAATSMMLAASNTGGSRVWTRWFSPRYRT